MMSLSAHHQLENKLEEAYKLLPNSTIKFLKSEKGKAIVDYLLKFPS